MKTKELKNLAKKIAKFEYIIQNSNDKDAIRKAEQEIMTISGSVKSFEDMILIDELVQELLAENS